MNLNRTRGQTFSERFCAEFECPSQEFEAAALINSFCPDSLALARLLLKIKPEVFALDFSILREVGQARSIREMQQALVGFRERYRLASFRDWVLLRIS